MDAVSLIPQFGGALYTLAAFVVALSVIVAVHEYGHYIVGRWSGIQAEVFSIGFGPVLWSRTDRRGTRWQVAALPFGGYVKFLGDADAASAGPDEAVMEAAAQDPAQLRRTMHGAPLWARAATVVAGPLFNFVLSIVVFAGIFMLQGEARDPLTVGEIHALPGGAHDLRPGDEILGLGGVPLPGDDGGNWDALVSQLQGAGPVIYDIRRDGTERSVEGPHPFPALVSQVAPRSAAMDAGLRGGDVIVAIDEAPIFSFDDLKTAVEGGNGRAMLLSVWRGGDMIDLTLAPRRTDEPQDGGGFVTNWRIGVIGGMAFEPATQTAAPGAALLGGVAQTWRIVESSLSGLWHMVTGAISTCNISGPVGIAETSGAMAAQGAQSFIWFIAVLSTAVGLLNLFPIPVLDGGHLLFHLYEAVAGRPPSDGALRILMATGLALILTLMLFAVANDLIFC